MIRADIVQQNSSCINYWIEALNYFFMLEMFTMCFFAPLVQNANFNEVDSIFRLWVTLLIKED